MQKLEFHEMANFFPLMEGADFDALVEDIAGNGLREAITLYQGKILDGRNRYKACLAAGVTPTFKEYNGNGSPLEYVISLNLHRRHLNESQRAMVAAKLATLKDGQRKVRQLAEVPTQPEAAKLLNVGERTVQRARQVLDHGTPELIAAVEQGEVAVSVAAGFAGKEPEMQRNLLDKIVGKKMKPLDALRRCKIEKARQSAPEFFHGPAPEIEGRPVKVFRVPGECRWAVLLEKNGHAIPYAQTIDYEVTPEFNEQLMGLKARDIAKLLLAGPEQAMITSEGVWSDVAYWFLPRDKIPGKRADNCWTGCGNEFGC